MMLYITALERVHVVELTHTFVESAIQSTNWLIADAIRGATRAETARSLMIVRKRPELCAGSVFGWVFREVHYF